MAVSYPTIGSESFIRIDGQLNGAGYETEKISRPHVDYDAFRLDALKAPPSKLNAVVDVTSNANAATKAKTTYPALKGTIVSIVMKGQTYANWLIRDVVVTAIVTGTGGVGGVNGGSIMVMSEWVVEYAGNT